MAVFAPSPSFLVKTFPVMLRKPQKISLIQELNWLAASPIPPLEEQWSHWDIDSDLRLDRRTFSWVFFSLLFYEVFGSVRWICIFQLTVYSRLFPALVAVETLSSIALQKTEMENLPKMIRVRIFASNPLRKYQTWQSLCPILNHLICVFFLFQERQVVPVQHLIIFGWAACHPAPKQQIWRTCLANTER